MIFDTDVLIFVQRANEKAARLIDRTDLRFISVQTYMELLQNALSKQQHQYIKDFLQEFNFQVIPFSENIGHRAAIYIEEYSLATGLRAGDAIIAASAIESNLPLTTANRKHFKSIKELQLNLFKP